jgi:UDPglucose 6-dehydrogenase
LDFWRNPWKKGWEVNLATKKRKLVVVGCGKLGAPLIACLANVGHSVVGVDLNKELIQNLDAGIVTWNEPGLEQLLTMHKENMRFQSTYQGAFEGSEATFVIVPTPSIESGEFSNRYVIDAVTKIGYELSNSLKSQHLVVIVSTVMPGSTQGEIKHALQSAAGGVSGLINICYSPEFIALGTVIKNMQFPDMVLIGEEEKDSGDLLAEISLSVAKNKPSVMRLSISEAEICKIAINSFVTTKISFSNQISEICENTPGASAQRVLQAIGADSRIGRSYLSAGTGYGGPCFPRDNRAFHKYARSLGVDADLSMATDAINVRQGNRIIRIIEGELPPASKILVVGLSYKPDTDVTEESPALAFIANAQRAGYTVDAVDDHVQNLQTDQKIQIFTSESLPKSNYSAAILFVPSGNYTNIPLQLSSETKLIDLWGLWENSQNHDYIRLGDFFEVK